MCVAVGGTTMLASASWQHYNAHIHSGDTFWVLEVLDSHFMFILYKYGFRKDNEKERYPF